MGDIMGGENQDRIKGGKMGTPIHTKIYHGG